MRVALALCAWLALGLPSAAVCWRNGRPALGIALLPFAGALAIAIPPSLAPWLGGSFAPWGVHALGASLAIALALLALSRGAPPSARAPWSLEAGAAAGVLACACALLVATGVALAQGWPGYGWDGLSIWLVRTKVLALRSQLPLELFAEPQIAGSHWDYPLLLPALLAWFARLADLELHRLSLALGAIAAVWLPAVAIGLRGTLAPALAASLALAPFAVPMLALRHFHAYADPLLALCATAGFAWSAAGAIRGDRALVAAGSLALACAALVKNEGMLWLLASAFACLAIGLAARAGLRAAVGLALRAAAPGCALFLVWRLTCARLGVVDTLPGGLRGDLVAERLAFVAGALLALLPPLLLALLVACALATWLRVGGRPALRSLRCLALLAAPAAYLAGILAIYLLTPHDVGWHVATSLQRTLFGVGPCAFAAALLAEPLRRAADAA